MNRKYKNFVFFNLSLTAWIALAYFIPAHVYASLDFRFERMWPRLEQPWYFSGPSAIAIAANGDVYIADALYHRIQVFDSQGRFLRQWGSKGVGNGQFNEPEGISITTDGHIVVVDTKNHRIQIFNATGDYLKQWGSQGSGNGQLKSPRGIAVTTNGNIVVADSANNRIQVFNDDGEYLNQWGSYGVGNGQFKFPGGIAITTNGKIMVADTFNHRIQMFSSNGDFLNKWGSNGPNNGQFSEPMSVAITANEQVLVTDRRNHRIQVFNINGEYLSQWGSEGFGNGQFFHPMGINVTSDGRIMVIDSSNDRIQIFSSNGAYLNQWASSGSQSGQFIYPMGISITVDGKYIVADTYNDRIQVFNANGEYINQWGRRGLENGQFDFPIGVASTSDGHVVVVEKFNHRIQVFNAAGNYLRQWGNEGSGNGQFNQPMGVAVTTDGRVVVADSNNNRIQIFSAMGQYIKQWGNQGSQNGQFDYPQGIAVISDGRIVVADTENHRVQIFSANGDYINQWGSKGSGNGQFNQPMGVTVTTDGYIMVTDHGNHRIQVFGVNGEFIGTFGQFGSNPGQFHYTTGIAAINDGRVVVADMWNSRIQVFTYSNIAPTIAPPRALIIGGTTNNSDALSNDVLSQAIMHAYTALQTQGYKTDNVVNAYNAQNKLFGKYSEIEVLWNGPPISQPKGPALQTKPAKVADFNPGTALTEWAQNSDRLLIYMVGRGIENQFYLDGETQETLLATTLNTWLNHIQPRITNNITLIYEASHSGSFLPILADSARSNLSKRIILTSAAADERAIFSLRGVNSYSHNLWTALLIGNDLNQALQQATANITVQAQANQLPQTDANGNGIPNESIDLQLITDLCVGIRLNSRHELARDCVGTPVTPPKIEQTVSDQILNNDVTEAMLWLKTNLREAETITSAWAVITRPDFVADKNQAFDKLTLVDLLPDSTLGKKRWIGRYAFGDKNSMGETQLGFDKPGNYSIAYYIKNVDGLLSSPLLAKVTKNSDSTTIKANLESPQQGSYESGIGLIRGWACQANTIEIQIDGGTKHKVAYGTNRGDTQTVCGHSATGFGFTYNWNSLSNGTHNLKVFADNVQFADVNFTTTNLGSSYLTGASGQHTVSNFPSTGKSATLKWSEPHQNFVIASATRTASTIMPPVIRAGITGNLESPQQNSYESGIGLIRGWVCQANSIELQIDGGTRRPVAYGTARGDTAATCNGNPNTGFGYVYNWNALGDGSHNLRLFVDNQEFTSVNFTVTTLGDNYLEGLSRDEAFNFNGRNIKVRWATPHQNFVIVP